MTPSPWRIVVLTEAGTDTGNAIPVAAGGADAWLAASEASAAVPKPGGGNVTLALRSAADFAPTAVAAALGGASGSALDAALHAPAFQRLESAYRGLVKLLEHAGDAVAIEVQSVPRKGLADRVRATLFERERAAEHPPALLIADYEFTHKGDDLATLDALAGMAKVLQAPLVASAGAGFFDFRYLVQTAALPELLPRLTTAAHAAFTTFQTTEPARWLALTVNRWLQRAPYTSADGGHAETVAESNPDSYLWGRGAWLVGAAVARSVREHGHALSISGTQGGSFSGMPTRAFPVAANATERLSAETTLTDNQVTEVYRYAFTPLMAPLKASLVMIPMAVTVTRLVPGRLTVEGTLAYQIMAGRLAQFCGRMLDAMPRGDRAAAAEFFRTELLGHLGALAGEAPEKAVTVEVREETVDDAVEAWAAIKVKPQVVLETKEIDFEFGLPLE